MYLTEEESNQTHTNTFYMNQFSLLRLQVACIVTNSLQFY